MVRISITAAFVASLALSAFASPVATQAARDTVIKVPVKKVHASSTKAVVAKDQARLAKANGYKSSAASSGAITNEVDSYLAAMKVGSQTFNLIVDTGTLRSSYESARHELTPL
jgi:hypothetical protein